MPLWTILDTVNRGRWTGNFLSALYFYKPEHTYSLKLFFSVWFSLSIFNPPTQKLTVPSHFISSGPTSISIVFIRQGDTQSMNIGRKVLLSFVQ